MSDIRASAIKALKALECPPGGRDLNQMSLAVDDALLILRSALSKQIGPVAWMHNSIDGNVITHRPFDIDLHPERWTALYPEPKPCPTCESLARTVMMDQTGQA